MISINSRHPGRRLLVKKWGRNLFQSELFSRTSGFLMIRIFLNQGLTLDLKKKLYAEIAERLHKSIQIRKEDIFTNLVEVAKENWSFGNGVAQYATE